MYITFNKIESKVDSLGRKVKSVMKRHKCYRLPFLRIWFGYDLWESINNANDDRERFRGQYLSYIEIKH